MTISYGSLCSGIEAASVAWEQFDWRSAWLSEIEEHSSKVLEHRFPDVANLGDMLEIPDMLERDEIEAPDILVGGTPCQAFSIAGKRKGMDDARGQLSLTYVEIANGIDRNRIRDGKQPCVAVWENVPGVLSQDDNAFGCFIAALAGDEEPVEPGERPDDGKANQFWTWNKKRKQHRPKWPVAGLVVGPQRTVAWIVRDAQYFGLAQRRRRVFVVASAREGFDPGRILFEPESMRRDNPPSRTQGQNTPGTVVDGAEGSSGQGRGRCSEADVHGENEIRGIDDSVDSGQRTNGDLPVRVEGIAAARMRGFGDYIFDETASTTKARDFKDATDLVIHQSTIAFDTTQITSPQNGCNPQPGDPSHPLAATGHPPAVVYAIQERAISENPNAGPDGMGIRSDSVAYTMEARSVPQAVAYGVDYEHNPVRLDGVMGPLLAGSPPGGGHPLPAIMDSKSVAYSYQSSQSGVRIDDIVGTITGEGYGSRSHSGVMVHGTQDPITSDIAFPLARNSGQENVYVENNTLAVRRLMPVECERLQGFPDNWTRIPIKHFDKMKVSKTRPAHYWEPDPDGGYWLMASDSQRYKQCGNSMATNVMAWLGARIQQEITLNEIMDIL